MGPFGLQCLLQLQRFSQLLLRRRRHAVWQLCLCAVLFGQVGILASGQNAADSIVLFSAPAATDAATVSVACPAGMWALRCETDPSDAGNGAYVSENAKACDAGGQVDVRAKVTCTRSPHVFAVVPSDASFLDDQEVSATCGSGFAVSCNCYSAWGLSTCGGASTFEPVGNLCVRRIPMSSGRRRSVDGGAGAKVFALCRQQCEGDADHQALVVSGVEGLYTSVAGELRYVASCDHCGIAWCDAEPRVLPASCRHHADGDISTQRWQARHDLLCPRASLLLTHTQALPHVQSLGVWDSDLNLTVPLGGNHGRGNSVPVNLVVVSADWHNRRPRGLKITDGMSLLCDWEHSCDGAASLTCARSREEALAHFLEGGPLSACTASTKSFSVCALPAGSTAPNLTLTVSAPTCTREGVHLHELSTYTWVTTMSTLGPQSATLDLQASCNAVENFRHTSGSNSALADLPGLNSTAACCRSCGSSAGCRSFSYHRPSGRCLHYAAEFQRPSCAPRCDLGGDHVDYDSGGAPASPTTAAERLVSVLSRSESGPGFGWVSVACPSGMWVHECSTAPAGTGNGAYVSVGGTVCVVGGEAGIRAQAVCSSFKHTTALSHDLFLDNQEVSASCSVGSAVSCNCYSAWGVGSCGGESIFSPDGNTCSRYIPPSSGRRRGQESGAGAKIFAVCLQECMGHDDFEKLTIPGVDGIYTSVGGRLLHVATCTQCGFQWCDGATVETILPGHCRKHVDGHVATSEWRRTHSLVCEADSLVHLGTFNVSSLPPSVSSRANLELDLHLGSHPLEISAVLLSADWGAQRPAAIRLSSGTEILCRWTHVCAGAGSWTCAASREAAVLHFLQGSEAGLENCSSASMSYSACVLPRQVKTTNLTLHLSDPTCTPHGVVLHDLSLFSWKSQMRSSSVDAAVSSRFQGYALVGALVALLLCATATTALGCMLGRRRRSRSHAEVHCRTVEPDADADADVCLVETPKYWNHAACNDPSTASSFDRLMYVGSEHHDKFNRLLDETYRARATQDRPCPTQRCPRTPGGCPCVQPGANPGLPAGYRVRRVVRVEDSGMWERYVRRRAQIKASRRDKSSLQGPEPPVQTDEIADANPELFQPLDASLNEVYLWHGTRVRSALAIAQEDFRIDSNNINHRSMFGVGCYFAENSTKADEYACDEPGGYYDGVFALMLCRVCLGKFFYTLDRSEYGAEQAALGNVDSTLGDRLKSAGTFREFVVYDIDQVYPEYLVLYTRLPKGADVKATESRLAAVPFHTELPVYWKHCYENPRDMCFHSHHAVQPFARDFLQRLAQASLQGADGVRVEILTARRVENSEAWNRYVDFKKMLWARLECRVQRSIHRGDGLRVGFTPVEELAGGDQAGRDVITRTHLQQQGVEDAVSLDSIEGPLNEHILWHGTSPSAAHAIALDDFRIPSSSEARNGQRFGHGAYFAEDLEKSLSYAPIQEGMVQFVLLCRVLCGDVYYTEKPMDVRADMDARAKRKHSVLANPRGMGPREFIVPDEAQVYCEYILQVRVHRD